MVRADSIEVKRGPIMKEGTADQVKAHEIKGKLKEAPDGLPIVPILRP
jgi:hypothetical protein